MKKLTCLLACLALVCAMMGGAAGEGFQPRLDTKAEYTLTVSGNYGNFEALEAAFDAFGQFYPNAQLQYQQLENYKKMISLALSGDEAPDIYFAYDWMRGREQYSVPLDKAEDLSDESLGLALEVYRPALLNRVEGEKTAIAPIFASAYGMLVNRDIFEKAGLSVPTDWAGFAEACEKLKAAGYTNLLLGYYGEKGIFSAIAMPYFLATIKDQPEAAAQMNAMAEGAGEYMRPTLEMVQRLLDSGYLDLEASKQIEDDYQAVILRFFEGDVPMMIATGDIVSGTAKREALSEAFQQHPFSYAFHPLPVADGGCWFHDQTPLGFAVNRDSQNLEIANEFMRFLISFEQLNKMAQIKRLLTPTTDLSLDGIYAPFAEVPPDRIVTTSEPGISDDVVTQVRRAAFALANGMTIDEAIAAYGTLE